MNRSIYPWVAIIILAVGVVPTVNSFYRGLPELPRQVSARMPDGIDGITGYLSQRNARKIERVFRTRDWAERIYTDAGGHRITSFVARSYDPRPLIHLPENGLLERGWSQREYALEHITIAGKAYPVHRLTLEGVDNAQFVYYLLLYADDPVGHPFWQLFSSVPGTLFHGREPYTLIFVSSHGWENSASRETAIKILFGVAENMTRLQSIGHSGDHTVIATGNDSP